MVSDYVVTGANGFVGSALVRALVAKGVSPVALVRTAEARAALVSAFGDRVRVRVTSLDDARAIEDALDGCEPGVVFHLAGGRALDTATIDEANAAANLAPTRALAAALGGRNALVVLASTGEVYGKQPGPFVEAMTPEPLTPYARAKVAAERALADGARDAPDFVIARLSVVYGPGPWRGAAAGMLVPRLIMASRTSSTFKMTSGEQTRDFLFVDDAARGLMLLAEAAAARGQIVNVGAGESHAVGDVARRVLAAADTGTRLELGAEPLRPNETLDYRFDTSRLRELTGFTPALTLDQGIALAVAGPA